MDNQNYRKARERAGIKAEKAASERNVSITTLFNWERGDTKPNADNLRDMARLYSVSIDYLLCMA
jgi:transcriptional regulator with XRE-family HTH domain